VATSHSITVSERAEGAGVAGAGEEAGRVGGVDMEGGRARRDGLGTRYSREKRDPAQRTSAGRTTTQAARAAAGNATAA
jgi:hypothetical protein